MSHRHRAKNPESDVNFVVDDETLEQLQSLEGQRVAAAIVWDDSVADALAQDELTDVVVDVDVYLSDGLFFELYGVLCYPSVDSDPLTDVSNIRATIPSLANSGIWLAEVAVDSEKDLVLVLSDGRDPVMFLNAGAWNLGEWEELPETA